MRCAYNDVDDRRFLFVYEGGEWDVTPPAGDSDSWEKEEEAKDKRLDCPARSCKGELVGDQLARCDSGEPDEEPERWPS